MTNIAGDLIHSFEAHRDAIAVVDPNGTRTTYAELLDAIACGRSRLAAAGLEPNSNVIVQAPKGIPFASATVALVAEGHTAIGIEMAQGDAVYTDRAAYVGADAVLTTRTVRVIQRTPLVRNQLAKRGIDVPPPIDVPTIDWDSPAVSSTREIQPINGEHIAFVVFTGGTSDRPKGVQLSHRSIRHYLDGIAQLPEWSRVTSLIADHPQQVLYGLAHGKTVHLSPARSGVRARRTAELLFVHGVDAYFGSPASWSEILATGVHRSATSWPTAVLLGGAPVTQSMLELLERELDASVAIRCLYGMSEAGLIAHISAADKLALLRSNCCPGDPVGRLAAGVVLETADDGELLVASPARFSGYVGEPPAGADDLFPTGDIGLIESDVLFLLGRKKNMIVQHGVNLYPESFESRLLQQHLGAAPAFDEVALIPAPPDRLGDERFVLFYAAEATDQASALEVCHRVLPAGHGPTTAVRLSQLPRTGRQNKIDRRSLVAQLAPGSLEAMHTELFDQILRQLPARSAERRSAVALRSITRRNLTRAQQLEPAAGAQIDPVFILGHQRSGTTLLHRALAASPGAQAMTLADMVAPHPLGWRLSRAASPLARLLYRGAQRTKRWGSVFERHELDPSAPEEEEWLFAAVGLSGFVPSAFTATLGLADFDDMRDRASWPAARRAALIELYAGIISAWHAHAGRGTLAPVRHVAKNPAFGPVASDLYAAFPTAKFIVAVRDAHDAICSRLALVAAIHDRTLTTSEVAVLVDDSLRQLRGLTSQLLILPCENVHLVAFSALMKDPRSTIDNACHFAGLQPPVELPVVRRSKPAGTPPGVPSTSDIAAAIPGFMELCDRLGAAS